MCVLLYFHVCIVCTSAAIRPSNFFLFRQLYLPIASYPNIYPYCINTMWRCRYFGCRNFKDGSFSPEIFKNSLHMYPTVKMIEIKLSQGAKVINSSVTYYVSVLLTMYSRVAHYVAWSRRVATSCKNHSIYSRGERGTYGTGLSLASETL